MVLSHSRSATVVHAFLVACALVVPSSADAQDAQPAPDQVIESPAHWQVAGVGADRRSVLISHTGPSPCGSYTNTVRVDLTEATSTRIGIKVVSSRPVRDPGVAIVCPAARVAQQITTVPIGVLVRGQTFAGPLRLPTAVTTEDWPKQVGPNADGLDRQLLQMPSLVGLRVPDAMQILDALGFDRSGVRFPGARRGFIRSQFPRADTLLDPAEPVIRLRVT